MTVNVEFEKKYVRPVWPSAPGQQHITGHLDIPVGDLDTAVAQALDAGCRSACQSLCRIAARKNIRICRGAR